MKIRTFSLLSSGVFAAVLLGASAASANVLTYQNVTFTTQGLSGNELQLTISNAPNANGDWTGVNYLGAIALNSSATLWTFSSASVTPSGTYTAGGLNATSGNCDGSGAGWVCFSWNPKLSLTNSMVFDITFNGAPSGGEDFSLPHLKLSFYTNSTDSLKTGSLLSMDIPGGSTSVPEPATLGLLAAGLAGLGFAFARRRRNI